MMWISWYQPTNDHRPVSYPPNPAILAWWCTGHTEQGATLCALVDSQSENDARMKVLKDWPEVEKWRFCENKDNKSFNSRFPLQDWMIERGCSSD